MEVTVTQQNYAKEVQSSDLPVLLDFWATWCGPCQMIAPVVAEIAKEYEGRLKVGKVNVDDEVQLAIGAKISSIPTLLLIRNGTVCETIVGYRTKGQLEDILNKNGIV